MAWLSFGNSGSVRRPTVKRSQAPPASVRGRDIGELMRCAVSSVLIINAMLQVLAAEASLNAGEADDKICTVRSATGEAR
jgi:hypothetical protein